MSLQGSRQGRMGDRPSDDAEMPGPPALRHEARIGLREPLEPGPDRIAAPKAAPRRDLSGERLPELFAVVGISDLSRAARPTQPALLPHETDRDQVCRKRFAKCNYVGGVETVFERVDRQGTLAPLALR